VSRVIAKLSFQKNVAKGGDAVPWLRDLSSVQRADPADPEIIFENHSNPTHFIYP